MKFSPKCRTNKLGMLHTILGSFRSFFNWERADIRPQIQPRKIPAFMYNWKQFYICIQHRFFLCYGFVQDSILFDTWGWGGGVLPKYNIVLSEALTAHHSFKGNSFSAYLKTVDHLTLNSYNSYTLNSIFWL